MATPVLKIAQDGYDVTTAASENLNIDSSRNQFKVLYSGQQTFSLNAGNSYSYTKTITHNLGYIPQALGWSFSIYDSGGGTPGKYEAFSMMPFSDYVTDTPSNSLFVSIMERTSTYIKFKIYEASTGVKYTLTDMQLTYMVFVDEE